MGRIRLMRGSVGFGRRRMPALAAVLGVLAAVGLLASTLPVGAQSRVSDSDLNGLDGAGNDHPRGIWSDDTTMWVADSIDDKVYAYRLSDGDRQEAKEFELDTDNDDSRGIWSDGTTLWVVDITDSKVYAYRLSDGDRQEAKEFELDTDNTAPTGIWSDGTTLWVVDVSDEYLYAYRLSDGDRQEAKEFELEVRTSSNSSGHNNWQGIWSDGTVLWAVDVTERASAFAEALALRLSDGVRTSSALDFRIDLETADSEPPIFMWSNGETIWVTNYKDGVSIRAYELPDEPSSVPDPPRSITAVPKEEGARVYWRGPTGIGSNIDGYRLTSSPAGHSCTTSSAYGTSCSFSGLENGTTYTFTVVAYNFLGDSTPLVAHPVRPPGDSGDPPTNVTAVAGDAQATVSWTPGADDGGSKVTGYTVRSHGGVTRRCYTNTADPNSNPTSCTVSNLENGTPYTFSVIARNYNGDSPASEHSDPVTPNPPGGM